MKIFLILAFLVVISAPVTYAEGVASMTDVTAANGNSIAHHRLAVNCQSQHGKTFVDLTFHPESKTPFLACSVTIYDEDGSKVLVQIDPVIHRAPKLEDTPDGSRVFFHVADELVNRIEIRYHLRANEIQTHVFTIKKGDLQKVADIPK